MADIQWQHGGQNFSASAAKSAGNEANRGFDFKQASTAWGRGHIRADVKHSTAKEQRYLLDGYMADGRAVRLGFTRRGDTVRIHTARLLSGREERELQRNLAVERSTAQRERQEKAVRADRAVRKEAIKERKRQFREAKEQREQAKKRENREDRER